MKQLLALVVLLMVLGVAGFAYRNALEHPSAPVPPQGGTATACTADAKLCPDGSSVGRTGPECAFAACALPNAEDASIGIGFVIPTGYVANGEAIGADETLRAVFDKPAAGSVPHTILIRRYAIPEGKTGPDVVLANTMFEPSGNTPKSLKEFKPVVINGKTYQTVVLERFEGVVHSAYYLVREKDVLKFEILEKDVKNWTDAKLKVEDLPEHKALQALLTSLQSAS